MYLNVRTRTDGFAEYDTASVPLPTEDDWTALGVAPWLLFSSQQLTGLVYSPSDPVYANNDPANKTCVWWMFNAANL